MATSLFVPIDAGAVTGSGALVLQVSPSLTAPDIGVATGTSLAVSGAVTGASSTLSGAEIALTVMAKSATGAGPTLQTVEVLKSALSGATVTATNLIPAGCFLIGVTIRVTTLITGATSFKIGDGSDDNRWGDTIAVAAGTTTTIADFTAAGYGQFTSANNVVLTANGSNFTAGAVRITADYLSLTAATS